MYSVVFVLFFFFFQAEDGIRDLTCDWSSDVCSSDLVAGGGPSAGQPSSWSSGYWAAQSTQNLRRMGTLFIAVRRRRESRSRYASHHHLGSESCVSGREPAALRLVQQSKRSFLSSTDSVLKHSSCPHPPSNRSSRQAGRRTPALGCFTRPRSSFVTLQSVRAAPGSL